MGSDQAQSESQSNGLERLRYSRRRQFMALGASVGASLLAGCSEETNTNGPGDSNTDGDSNGSGDSNDAIDSDADSASFRLLISDRPADIGDFDRLDVSFDSARIFPGGGEESNDEEGRNEESDDSDDEESGGPPEEDDEGSEDRDEEESNAPTEDEPAEPGDKVEQGRGFYILDLDGATVDLTRVVGNRAMPIFESELSEGAYEKIELHASEVEGVVDGERAEVKVPSEKLQITTPFELRADTPVDFVFDINVVKRGQENSYNLTPVISESGVAGEDIEIEEVDNERREGENEETEGAGNSSDSEDTDEETADNDGETTTETSDEDEGE